MKNRNSEKEIFNAIIKLNKKQKQYLHRDNKCDNITNVAAR